MVFSLIRDRWNKRKAEKQRIAEKADLAIWDFYHSSRTIDDVDSMSGRQFEEFLARLFAHMGYTEIRLTSTNDQGGDLICIAPDGSATVVQAKRWSGPVGNSAVQELLGAMRHYSCTKGIVATNSTFTRSAIQLTAGGSDITLRDRQWLKEKIGKFLPPTPPEFDSERFAQLIQEFVEITRESARQGKSRRNIRPPVFHTLPEALRFAGRAKGDALSVKEIKRLCHLVIKASVAETEYREIDRRYQDAKSRHRELVEELADLDEALK